MNKVNFKNSVIFWLALISVLLAKAVPSAELVISQSPLTVKDTAAPHVMLAMSRDHQLYTKAYTDYSDFDGDGMLEPAEITYNNSVDYYGYFDSNKCYTYNGGLFVPSSPATLHQCTSQWSGNFLNWATMTRMDIIRKVLYGGYRSTDDATNGSNGGVTVLERTMIPYDAHAFVKVFSSTASDMLNYTPYSQAVISICNLTQGSGLSKNINTSTYPPLMRVASGSWPGWAASATLQCQWGSGALPASATVNPSELNVRVKVCANGQEETNCKGYSDKNSNAANPPITKKPTGLLQKYWESDKPIYFGLMTGSWGKSQSGGVLRAIAQNGDNEIDPIDGRFLSPVNSGYGGIIATLNLFSISGYHFNNNRYGGDEDWGNPLSEIYLETLRYLAGKGSHTPAFASNNENGYLPPRESYQLDEKSWNIPIDTGNWCAKCSIIAISAGANSFDTDELANDLTTDAGNQIDAASQTDTVGGSGLEDINGHSYFIGENGSDHNQRCTGKTLSSLSAALGICPEAPSLEGGYSIAGLAYFARTHDFFTTESTNPNQPDEVYFEGTQSINTYSVDLSQNLPHFQVPLGSGTITFLPACEANSNASASSSSTNWKACAMIDLKVDSLTYDNNNNLVSGRFTVVWEDATAGSDFDMDGIERLEFRVASNRLEIITTAVQTDSPKAMRFGYTIAGSNTDGLKLPVLCGGNSNCNASDATLYDGSSTIVKFLESPLWYAAKYGGFDTIDPSVAINNQKPQNQSWDEDNNGIPDAFFKGTNPALLESALDEILNKVSSKLASSSSVAAANSTRLDTSAALFQAKFSPAEWTGQLLAYRINPADGSFASTPVWDAGQKVTTQGPSARNIYSYHNVNKNGIAFIYNQLSQAQQGLLTPDELDYIRGVQLEEQPNGLFRKRTGVNGLMGDIVNSDPKFISSTSQDYFALPAAEGSDYLRYINSPAFVGRAPMLAVGANDGMLHVFNASLGTGGGQELLAYVPSAILGKLKSLTLPTYITNGKHQYFVDGSPNAGDAYIDADGDGDKEWRTVLAGTLGAGGKGLFALDLTFLNPNDYASHEAFSANRVLWEINDQTAPNAADLTDDLTSSPKRYGFTHYLGLTIGQASIARMANGQFAAVFGNGYNSASHMAVLYIVDIKTGRLIRSINTGVGNNSAASTLNGLTTPLAVDANGDRITDAIYAGDYQGNLWKFDVSDSNSDNWGVAFTAGNQPAPLFKASSSSSDNPYFYSPGNNTPIVTPQPITAKPEFTQHPRGGIMLYFGTGKYFESADNLIDPEKTSIESFYGIWDDCVNYAGANASCSSNVPGSQTAEVVKSQLVQQTITYEDISKRVTSRTPVDYGKVNPDKGWYMNLYYLDPINGPGFVTGERVISQPIIRNQRIIFTSLYPDATGKCVSGGSSWLTLLDALSGKALDVSAFVENGSLPNDPKEPITVNILGTDTSISGIKSDAIIDTPAAIATKEETAILASTGADGETFKAEISEPDGGRLSWLQLR